MEGVTVLCLSTVPLACKKIREESHAAEETAVEQSCNLVLESLSHPYCIHTSHFTAILLPRKRTLNCLFILTSSVFINSAQFGQFIVKQLIIEKLNLQIWDQKNRWWVGVAEKYGLKKETF